MDVVEGRMQVRQFTKRPLTVEAFRFSEHGAHAFLPVGSLFAEIRDVRLKWHGGSVWYLYNPGREGHPEGPWQRVHDGDYVIIAPTGCRYPVQADQFDRNYAELIGDDLMREVA